MRPRSYYGKGLPDGYAECIVGDDSITAWYAGGIQRSDTIAWKRLWTWVLTLKAPSRELEITYYNPRIESR